MNKIPRCKHNEKCSRTVKKKNNYKILPGDTQINMKKRKYNSIIRRCGVMKMSVLCNLIYKFDIIPVKIQKHFFLS